ncbi:MAG TPA: HAD-IIA family hydrolase [Gaiellales bacterium]|nr:HAD-IIA family hydrolase [Gaiellales bacterium]
MTPVRGIVLDMEGVLHVDWRPIPGSPQAVAQLAAVGIVLGVLTNTTGRTRADIAERLAGMGFELPAERIITAASAAADHLRENHAGARVFAMVEAGVRPDLEGISLVDDPAGADVVLLGGPDESWTYGRLNAVFRVVRTGVPLVAMQRNRWWPTADGPSLDAGMFVAGLEYAASVSAEVIGKPSPAIYRTACGLLGVAADAAMMVGDDPESDLAPAAGIGMRTCLVRTGKGSSFGAVEVDLDLPDLAALPQAIAGLPPHGG